jgi:hypothetical protein
MIVWIVRSVKLVLFAFARIPRSLLRGASLVQLVQGPGVRIQGSCFSYPLFCLLFSNF